MGRSVFISMAEEEKEAASESSTDDKPSKNKKINKMNLQEVDTALKKTEEKMGGLTSRYARALASRKEELSAEFSPTASLASLSGD